MVGSIAAGHGRAPEVLARRDPPGVPGGPTTVREALASRSGPARRRSRGQTDRPGGARVLGALLPLGRRRGDAGSFSDGQLWLTLVAEAATPVFVVGLYLVQRPAIGRLGLVSAAAYAYAYVFFTGTVVYALVEGTADYDALSDDLGAAMTIHGAIMLLAGLGFGCAVIRARVLPAWTGAALMVGVVLVALTQGTAEGVQLIAAGIRDLGFAGMGAALLRAPAVRTA
jgi:hypothetical protein